MTDSRITCPCCGYRTLPEPNTSTSNICPVCYWEYDPVQRTNPLFADGTNSMSLEQARANFQEFGACERAMVRNDRPPNADEMP